jgi:hypothetical protein
MALEGPSFFFFIRFVLSIAAKLVTILGLASEKTLAP